MHILKDGIWLNFNNLENVICFQSPSKADYGSWLQASDHGLAQMKPSYFVNVENATFRQQEQTLMVLKIEDEDSCAQLLNLNKIKNTLE